MHVNGIDNWRSLPQKVVDAWARIVRLAMLESANTVRM